MILHKVSSYVLKLIGTNMEKNLSNIFFILEKRKNAKSHIRKNLNWDSLELSEPETLLPSIKSFYSTLYKKRNYKTETDCYNYLRILNLRRLTDDESRHCEGELTEKKCWEALQTIGNNKGPGHDGLSEEFYVCFFNEIHSYLLQALNMSFREEQLSSSQRQTVIVLIEKMDTDKRFLKNLEANFPYHCRCQNSVKNNSSKNQEDYWKISSL